MKQNQTESGIYIEDKNPWMNVLLGRKYQFSVAFATEQSHWMKKLHLVGRLSLQNFNVILFSIVIAKAGILLLYIMISTNITWRFQLCFDYYNCNLMIYNGRLTHWGRDKLAAIFQTTFWNGFAWMKMFEYRLKYHRRLFLRVKLTIFRHWFR